MKNLLLLLLLIYSINNFSQYTLTGKISNSNNEPISGAEIYLPQLHKGSVSDIDGNYTINKIPKGTHKIILLHVGYETITSTIKIENNINKKFTLNETAFEMNEIIISTPFNKLQSHNVMKVESIQLADLKNIDKSNLSEKLAKIPGVSSIETGNGIGKPVIRGLSGNRVLVYNQGVKYENFQSGEKHGLGINESGINNVEVIKGPASLLYGSDALGGVIYLVPEKFERINNTSTNFSSSFQSNSLAFNNSIGFKTSSKKIKFLARASYNTQSDYKTANGTRVSNSRFNNKDFKTGIGFENNNYNVDIRYNYNQAFNGITHGINKQSTSKEIEGLYQELNNHIVSAKSNFFFNKVTLKTTVGFTHHNRNLFKMDVKKIDMDLNTINYDVKAHLANTGKIETIFGIQGMYQTNTNYGDNIFLPNASIFDFGAFITSNYEFNNNTLQAGIRFDNRNIDTEEHGLEGSVKYFSPLNKSLNNITGAAGLKLYLNENLISRINLSLGFRAPNLSELTANGFHEGRFEFGNNDLNNEKNIQYDVNFEYSNKIIELFINGFYNRIKNYIVLVPNGENIDNFAVYTYNQNNSKLYGGEFGFHFHPSKYKWLHLKTSGESVTGLIDNGEYLPRIPGFTIKNNMKFDFSISNKLDSNYLTINNRNIFEQSKISEHENNGEAYSLFDIGIGSSFKINNTETNISIIVNNLLNKNYIDHLSVLKEDDIPNSGINIAFGIDFKF